MRDELDPTEEELEAWARTPGAMYPTEDWDIIIAVDHRGPLFLRLAADRACANRDACLNFLYVYAGQVVREGKAMVALRTLITNESLIGQDNELRLWATRVGRLLDGAGPDPRSSGGRTDYEFWFMRGWRGVVE